MVANPEKWAKFERETWSRIDRLFPGLMAEMERREGGEEYMSAFSKHGADIGQLVAEKQKAYGDSFGKAGGVLKILYPDGVKPEQYTDMLCIVRILDKLFRIATAKDAFEESPYKDIVGYGLLGFVKDEPAKGSIEPDE